MSTQKIFGILAFLLCIETSSAGILHTISKRGTLLVGMEAGYIPFEMKNKKGELIGLDVELAQLIAREMGVKLKLVNTEWDGIIPSLLTEKYDVIISGMSLTPDRNMKIMFSDPYLVIGQTIILAQKNKNKIKSYKDLNQSQFTIVSKMGTTGESAIKKLIPKAKYRAYQTEQEAVMEVASGKVDAYVYDYPYNAVYAAGPGKNKVIHLSTPFTYEPIAIGLRQGDTELLNWLNNFLRQIKNDGRFKVFEDKWLHSTNWQKDL